MIQQLLRYGIIGLLLFLLQLAVVNNMVLFKLLHPYLYPMLLIILPFGMPQWSLLLTCFGVGLTVDLFTFTPGMHASACVTAGFVRPYLLNTFTPIQGTGDAAGPHLHVIGWGNFLLYSLFFLLIHQLTLHFIEVFSFSGFWRTLLRVVINTAASWLLVMVVELLAFYRNTAD
jgi:rod shape-determining protein MreD